MANYSAADVKKLRELTGAGFMDCKKALEENEGDFDKAIEFLRIKNAKNASKRAERTTAEGMVAASGNASATATRAPLTLAGSTDFPGYTGDFDHFAIATKSNRMFLAGEESAELEVMDLATGKLISPSIDSSIRQSSTRPVR